MKRKLLYLTTIILPLAGCASEDYVGDENLHEANDLGRPVSFNLVAAPRTRAVGGVGAANMLNRNFVVYARKWFADQSDASLLVDPQLVFDNYLVQYADNSANTTTSNSAGWEYVGYYNLPSGTTDNAGIPSSTTGRFEQSIKYWDFAANQYDFLAYSLGVGTGSTPTYADATELYYDDKTSANEPPDDDYIGYKYTLTGTSAQLAACYISDLESKTNMNPTNTQVQLKFRKLGANIKIALYETIPGYSVKDVKFYKSDADYSDVVYYTADEATAYNTANSLSSGDDGYKSEGDEKTPAGQTACLYSSAAFVHNDGTFTVTFANGTPNLTWEDRSGVTTASSSFLTFGDISDWTPWAGADYMQAAGNYIGRSSDQATTSASVSVLPNPTGAALKLKVDYTLLSRDKSEETIKVTGATAIVPAQYAAWKPNCSYTYLFKISDNTNGQIGTETGLYPITLDAVVSENADGKQETITTVSEPSITTYSSNSNVVTNNEYAAGEKVYAVVEDAGSLATLSATNMKLYTVTTTNATNFPITESSVADALLKQTTLTAAQATAASIKCTNATSSLQYSKKVGDTEEIEMDASNNVVAYFTVEANKVYVLQYINTDATYTYDAGQTYADAAAFAAAGTLYTKSGDVYTEATTWTDGTTYYKRTAVSSEGVYAYKDINVASGS